MYFKKAKTPFYLVLVLFFSSALSFTSCMQKKLQDSSPACVTSIIEQAQKKAVQNPPTEIWEWKLDGKTYYYVNAPCCDQFSTLYDDQCQRVCAPSGGIAGKGDGRCPENIKNAEKKLLWKDSRKRN